MTVLCQNRKGEQVSALEFFSQIREFPENSELQKQARRFYSFAYRHTWEELRWISEKEEDVYFFPLRGKNEYKVIYHIERTLLVLTDVI